MLVFSIGTPLADVTAGRVGRHPHKSRPPFDFAGTRPLLPTNPSPNIESFRHNGDLSIDLDQRKGWPAELRVLLDRYPRKTWIAYRSSVAHFWLEIHDGFRGECAALQMTTDDYRDDRTTAQEFAALVSPRLRAMISHLHGHHQIEDFHYFPSFRAAEARLARGFETLENDHGQLQRDIAAAIGTLSEFLATAHAGRDSSAAQRQAAERYVAASELLYRRLCRHLSDEEDLIIPLLLDRGR